MLLAVMLFVTVFASVAILLLLVSGSRSKEYRQALDRLESIGAGPRYRADDEEAAVMVRREEVLTGVKWLDRWLQDADLARRLRMLLYQAGVNWTPVRLILISVVCALASGFPTFLRTDAVLLSLLVAVAAGSIPLIWVFRQRAKRFYKLKERLPEALDLMVSAMRAGHSFASGMGMASRESPEPVKGEFRQCFDEQNYGLDLRLAMTNLVRRAPLREVRMISTAVLIQKETGGNLTEILEKVSALIRDDFRLQRQVGVHTAQGRLTGLILALLPPVLGIALYIVNPEQMSMLWRNPVGLRMLEGSVVMTLVGGLIIRRIVRVQI